jgi:hypothetical protein
VRSQLAVPVSVGLEAPLQLAVHAFPPQLTLVLLQAEPAPHSMSQVPTAPQTSSSPLQPLRHCAVQACSLGHRTVEPTQAEL